MFSDQSFHRNKEERQATVSEAPEWAEPEWAATGSEILQATESEEPEKAEKKANPLELL
jgi:hypothetical protein